MATRTLKYEVDEDGLPTCRCGGKATVDAVSSGFGLVIYHRWICPTCLEVVEAEVRKEIEELPF